MTHTTHNMPSLCPHCGYKFDAVTNMDGDTGPKPGDWTLCLRCAGPMMFDAALRPAMPEAGHYEALRQNAPDLHRQLERHRAAILQLARIHPIPDRGGRA
jgi:hypothetical protein